MLTVLMATHNGERTLPRVLEAYCRLHPPQGGWRLLVVDNASTDATREVVRAFARRLPIDYLFEPVQGQNRARNAGLAAIEGNLVVFADDDAVPREDWLARLRQAADARPDFSIFGGTILPRWEQPPEEWLLRWVPLGPCFAITDRAWQEGGIKTDFVFSPNMAIRAEVFRGGCRFDEGIGPRRGLYAMGSETELTRRLASQGARAWHCPQAVVEHIIRASQMTRRWVLQRAIRYGRGQYRLSEQRRSPQLRLLGVPLRLLARAAVTGLAIPVADLRGDREAAFRKRWSLHYLYGRVLESRALAASRHRRSAGRRSVGRPPEAPSHAQ
jgi:glycosyltransferase involved in cell wall biosynthesis